MALASKKKQNGFAWRRYQSFLFVAVFLSVLSYQFSYAGSDAPDVSKGYEYLHNGQLPELVKLLTAKTSKKGYSSVWDELAGLYDVRANSGGARDAAAKMKLALQSDQNNDHLLATYALVLIFISDDAKDVSNYAKAGNRAAMSMRQEAVHCALRAVSLAPKEGRNHAVLAACYAALMRNDEAAESFTQAIKLSPNDVTVNELAYKFYSVTALDGKASIGCYERLTKELPNSPYMWVKLGEAKANDNDLNGALQAYTIAIQKNPKYVMAYIHRAGLERHMQRWQDAVRDYSVAVPTDALYRRDRSDCYEKLNQHDKALADMTLMINTMTLTYEKMKGVTVTPANEKDFQAQLAKSDKNYRNLLLKRVVILGELGRYEDAISSIGPILVADPLNEAALDNRQIFYRKTNRYKEALADLNKLLILHEAPEWFKARADVYTHLGQTAKAAADEKRSKEPAY